MRRISGALRGATPTYRIVRNRYFPTRRSAVGGKGSTSGNDIRSSYGGAIKLRSVKYLKKKGLRSKASRKGLVKYRRHASKLQSILYKHLCTPQVIKWTYANSYSGTQGQRQYTSHFLGGEQLIKYLALKRPSNFLYDTSTPSGTLGGTYQDLGQQNWLLHIDKVLFNFRVQNRSNASMELKVYECVIREGCDVNVLGINSKTAIMDLIKSGVDKATNIGSQGNAGPGQQDTTTGVGSVADLPTCTPYDSNPFTSSFKVLRQASHKLGPNEIKTMAVNLRPRMFKGSWINSGTSGEWQRGWSKVILFSWVGQPVDDGSLNKNTKAICDLSFQYDAMVKFHFMPGQQKLVNFVMNTPGSTSGGISQYGPQFFGYSNGDSAVSGTANQYYADPAGFTAVVPASETVQTVPGYNSTGGTVTATGTAPSSHP